jgi:uncharacterized membrane protein
MATELTAASGSGNSEGLTDPQSPGTETSKDIARVRDALVDAGVQQQTAERASVRVVHEFASRYHSGPLPPADVFSEYEAICPGAAREILDMAVREQAHSHSMDRDALRSEVQYRKLSIIAASLIVVSMIGAATVCAVTGHEYAAVALGGAAALSTLAGVFVRGRNLFDETDKNGPRSVTTATRPKQSSKAKPRSKRR